MPTQRFLVLDGLRLVFALIVVVAHVAGPVRFHRAYLAVDFFFILSGFVLTWAYWNRAQEPGILRTFAIERVARLYPLHLATFAIMVVLYLWSLHLDGDMWPAYEVGFFVGFLYNLLMLQGLEPAAEVAISLGLGQPYTWNGPAWSIAVEFWGNLLLAPLLVALAFARSRLAVSAMLAVAAGSYALLGFACANLGCESPNGTIPLFNAIGAHFLRGLGGMVLGVLCCGLVHVLRRRPAFMAASAPTALLSGAALVGLVILDRPNYGDAAAIIGACALVCSVALYEHRNPLRFMPRLSAVLLIAGALSYAVYLMHSAVIVLANLLFPGWLQSGVLPTVLITLLAIAVSFPTYYLFELPAKRATRAWLSQRIGSPARPSARPV